MMAQFSPRIEEITVGVFWLGGLPSTCGSGRPSKTIVQQQSHLQHPEMNSLSQLRMRSLDELGR